MIIGFFYYYASPCFGIGIRCEEGYEFHYEGLTCRSVCIPKNLVIFYNAKEVILFLFIVFILPLCLNHS